MSMSRGSSFEDDEQLARMLQYQEQASLPAKYLSSAANSSSNVDDQELRDLQLARDMSRRDMEASLRLGGAVPSDSELLPSPVASRRSAGPQRSRSYDGSSPEQSMEWRRRSSLRPAGTSPKVMDASLAYARQLQEQAFQNLQDHSASEPANALEQSDLELAWRMQELEISESNASSRFDFGFCKSDGSTGFASDEVKTTGSTSASVSSGSLRMTQEEDDLRLARYLESTGSSMRDLSAGEITSIFESAEGSQDSMQVSNNTLGTIDRQIALTRSHVTPPSSAYNSPVVDSKPPIAARVGAIESPDAIRLTQSTAGRERPALPQQIQEAGASRNGVPLSAPAHATSHVHGSGLPILDPIYKADTAADKEKNKSGKKKRGSFLRFRQSPANVPSKAALLSMDIDDISPPDAHFSSSSFGASHASLSHVHAARVSPRPSGSRSWLPRSPVNDKSQGLAETSTKTNKSSGPGPHTGAMKQDTNTFRLGSLSQLGPTATRSSELVCTSCGQMRGSFIIAMDRPYHRHCFRCQTCRKHIDHSAPFAISTNERGEKRAHHPECYAEAFAVRCTVCDLKIPATKDGAVSFSKHPFFENEIMCLRHAEKPGRRCSGCNRFEPENARFADLNDKGRCLCYACCRSVVVDSADIGPLWKTVILFFETHLKVPVWDAMRNIPIVVVQSTAMNEAMNQTNSPHQGHSQMARGACLVNHDHHLSNRRLMRAPSMRFERSSKSFRSMDTKDDGYTYFDVPPDSMGNPNTQIHAILCLSGLPRDLTASILAHEAFHAWIKLHPQYDFRKPLPPKVEEGCAQLIAMLLLNDGLDRPPFFGATSDDGPSDEKLRQYFKFCIEREESEIFGEGYRSAAAAYRDIGIKPLLDHVVRYREIPST